MTPEHPYSARTRRILVVDDNEDALLVMRLLLQAKGYAVETCLSGQQALALAATARPEVILLDISMPGMDGYETCRRLRQLPGGNQQVVIALTGYGQADDVKRATEAGFAGHLLKPVDLTELTNLLESLHPEQNQSND